ncbi:hypothetical protein [Flavobacterium selenitireducens]|uniref:hypothetical protein n=1 Tax=Flavobacterium selenitireducens TaxID=2722704 RepID=UPI00168A4A1D|nr:hypothetical protein [Flavobacterium selenitireducens]MBD3582199.1 hypothetical protein [Flavobacterium selenitireducens]
MKKLSAAFLILLALGCESGDHPVSTSGQKTNSSVSEPGADYARTSQGDLDFKNAMRERYGASTEFGSHGLITITYPDQKKLYIASTQDPNIVIIEGSAINDGKYKLVYDADETKSPDQRLSITTMRLPVNPCVNHPINETFGQCFVREFQAFCDGFTGCAAIATNPVGVSAAIGAHCALCR